MQKTGLMIAGLSALTLGLAACSPKPAEPVATPMAAAEPVAPPMADMPMTPASLLKRDQSWEWARSRRLMLQVAREWTSKPGTSGQNI